MLQEEGSKDLFQLQEDKRPLLQQHSSLVVGRFFVGGEDTVELSFLLEVIFLRRGASARVFSGR